jgi:hypothetical protein
MAHIPNGLQVVSPLQAPIVAIVHEEAAPFPASFVRHV